MIISNDTFKVYAHINKINGKMYVGITKQPVLNRWKNGTGYKESPIFSKAIAKYGWDNFDHEIIADKLTEKEAMMMEYFLIQTLKLQDDQYGYNMKNGGTECSLAEETKIKIGNALRGRKYSDEKRKIYSEAHKGKSLSSSHAKAIAKANKGRPRTENEKIAAKNNGIKMSGDNHWTRRLGIKEETKKKISATLHEYYKTHESHKATNKKSILQLETGIVYESIEDAANKTNIWRSSISEAAVGIKRKTAGGFHWEFV